MEDILFLESWLRMILSGELCSRPAHVVHAMHFATRYIYIHAAWILPQLIVYTVVIFTLIPHPSRTLGLFGNYMHFFWIAQ